MVFEIGRRLASYGHHVLVITLATAAGPGQEIMEGMEVRRYPCFDITRSLGVQLSVSTKVRRGIYRDLREFCPEIVNAHNLFFATTVFAVNASRKLGIPSVTTLHLGSLDSLTGWRSRAARLYERTVGKRVLAQSDAVIAVSRAVADQAKGLTGGSTPVFVVENGVDSCRFRPGTAASGSEVRGIFVGRLIFNKGPQFLLAALGSLQTRLPNLKIDIVGEGPMRRKLEVFVRHQRLDDTVNFLGIRDDVPELLRRSDFFIRPSLLEGMPLTVLEAMASGLPVVVSDVGGAREVVVDGVTGYLVPPGSVRSLEGALLRLASDGALRTRMGKAGQALVTSRFSWEAAAQATADVFERVRTSTHG